MKISFFWVTLGFLFPVTPPRAVSTTHCWRSSWWPSAALGCCCPTTCCAAAWLWSPCCAPVSTWVTTSAWPPSPTSSAARCASACSSTTPASQRGFSVSSSPWESSLCSGKNLFQLSGWPMFLNHCSHWCNNNDGVWTFSKYNWWRYCHEEVWKIIVIHSFRYFC